MPVLARLRRDPLFLCVALLVVLWLPGFVVYGGRAAWDDWWIRAALEGHPTFGAMTPFDLFRFTEGDPEKLRPLQERGPLPWFAHPEIRIALFRPLSVLTHHVDHLLLGGATSRLAAIHSLAWAVGFLVAAERLYREILPARAVFLATLLFTIAGSHVEPLAWTAARNTLVSACFGTWALVLHVRARRDGRIPGEGAALFLLALLGGEVALGCFVYLFAFEFVERRRDGSSAVARALSPYVAILGLWFTYYFSARYGTGGSGFYANPFSEPLTFLVEFPGRFLALVSGALLAIPPAILLFRPETKPLVVALGCLALGLVLFVERRSGELEERARGSLRFLGVGALMSLVPQTSGLLGQRSLVMASLGVAPFIAVSLLDAKESFTTPGAKRSFVDVTRILVCALLALVHFVLGPSAWLVNVAVWGGALDREDDAFARSDLTNLQGRDVFVVTTPDPVVGFYWSSRLGVERGVHPRSWNVLSSAPVPHRLERTGPASFRLHQPEEPLPTFENVVRSASLEYDRSPLDLGVWSAVPEETYGAWRKKIRFDFEAPLDTNRFVFLAWQDGALRRVQLPTEGQTLELPLEKGPWNVF